MEIITRNEWGARTPKDTTRISLPVRENWLHHTVNNWYGIDGMRRMQYDHMYGNHKWNDIGYSFVYDPKNNVWYEGRGWGVQGSHTYGRNSVSHGFAVIGNFENERPSQSTIDALAWMMNLSLKKGYGPGSLTGGHKDVRPTACPGRYLYPKIADINALALQTRTGGDEMAESDFPEVWQWARDNGIASEHTKPGDVVTADTLMVFLNRAYKKKVFGGTTTVTGVSVREVLAEIVRRLS